ncbi:hypothetical protein FRB90_009310 [Tulasnella sp. 427]|nr:hypothetical protein FRB90_009310 [Tulasnella sp. 427]
MPFRSSKSTNNSLFSRTLHAQNSEIVHIEQHTVPPPIAPQDGLGNPMRAAALAGVRVESRQSASMDTDTGEPMADPDRVQQADRAYSQLIAHMMEEPRPQDGLPDSVPADQPTSPDDYDADFHTSIN